jgi:xylobiose transport system permease protein
VTATGAATAVPRTTGPGRVSRPGRSRAPGQRANPLAGLAAFAWLLVVALPLFVLLNATFKTQSDYTDTGPLAPPTHATLSNYHDAVATGFGRYLLNTTLVTAAVVGIVLLLAPPLAYCIVRGRSRAATGAFRLFLLGLAIPAQAVIVPVFYVISSAGLYDNLLGVILPTAAFALPVCTLVLSGAMRDITSDLYEAMAIDGASSARTFGQLVLPLSRGGLATIVVFAALQAWNGFLFPLILTQSQSTKVVTLGLYDYQTEHGINVPGLLAAVVVSTIPVLVLYLFARRALIQGLMGVGGR